jgi:hypothetical protein
MLCRSTRANEQHCATMSHMLCRSTRANEQHCATMSHMLCRSTRANEQHCATMSHMLCRSTRANEQHCATMSHMLCWSTRANEQHCATMSHILCRSTRVNEQHSDAKRTEAHTLEAGVLLHLHVASHLIILDAQMHHMLEEGVVPTALQYCSPLGTPATSPFQARAAYTHVA